MASEVTVIKQLLIDLEVENNAEDDLKSTRAQTIELANDTDELIGQLKKGDAQFARVAASLEKITDRELRAKEAVKAHTRAFSKQTGVLSKLGDQVNVARARLDSMGAAGQVLKAGALAAAAGVAALGAAIAKTVEAGVKILIADSEEATVSLSILEGQVDELKHSVAELAIGTDNIVQALDIWTARTLVLNTALDDLESTSKEYEERQESMGIASNSLTAHMNKQHGEIGFLTFAYQELTIAIDNASGATETLNALTGASDAGEKALELAKKAQKFAEGELQLTKEQTKARELVDKILDKNEAKLVAREKAAAAAGKKRLAEEAAAFSKFLTGIDAASKRSQAFAEKRLEKSKELSDARLKILADEEAEKARLLSSSVTAAFATDPESERLTRLIGLQAEFDEAQSESRRQAQLGAQAIAGLANSFVGLAEGIATGEVGLKEAAKGMMSAFGDIMIQLGTGIVLSAEALAALFTGNAPLALGAGLALIAGGIAIKAVLSAGSAPGGFAGDSAQSIPDFTPTTNDFDRRSEEQESRTVNVFIGQHQIRGPLQEVTQDLVRRGEIPAISGSAFS